jgi:ABC-type lipoprotein release transport system permease subunit
VAAGSVLKSIVFGVTASDPRTVAGVCVLMLASSIVASCLPALKAGRVSVTTALHNQ